MNIPKKYEVAADVEYKEGPFHYKANVNRNGDAEILSMEVRFRVNWIDVSLDVLEFVHPDVIELAEADAERRWEDVFYGY
ncbi:MAG: hypothetical protein LAT56_00350 [Wenzhouxiangella sp.]|nr:hypothetical protein [Wenzhouxiangella sp.]